MALEAHTFLLHALFTQLFLLVLTRVHQEATQSHSSLGKVLKRRLTCFGNRRVDLNKLTNIHTPHLWGTAKTNSMLVLARVCLVFRVKLHQ